MKKIVLTLIVLLLVGCSSFVPTSWTTTDGQKAAVIKARVEAQEILRRLEAAGDKKLPAKSIVPFAKINLKNWRNIEKVAVGDKK